MKQYQCKIIVKDSKPPIWWRCLIPADISFSALSLILDEIIGETEGDSFFFDMLHVAKIWEPTEAEPLKRDGCHSAYNAAAVCLRAVFDQGKTINYRRNQSCYRIEIEAADNKCKQPMVTLLKVSKGIDDKTLFDRLPGKFRISKEYGTAPQTRQHIKERATDGVFHMNLVSTNLEDEAAYQPSTHQLIRKMSELIAQNCATNYWSTNEFVNQDAAL